MGNGALPARAGQRSAYRAVSIAENRAAFSLRRRRSLGFSKCRWLRTVLSVPSRSIFFFNRRRAFSTDSPFFSLISVKLSHFLSNGLWRGHHGRRFSSRAVEGICAGPNVNGQFRVDPIIQVLYWQCRHSVRMPMAPLGPICHDSAVGGGRSEASRGSASGNPRGPLSPRSFLRFSPAGRRRRSKLPTASL